MKQSWSRRIASASALICIALAGGCRNEPPKPLPNLVLDAYAKDKPLEYVLEHLTASNVNERNDFGSTALHYAIRQRQWSLIRHLVDKGADVNACDITSATPIMHIKNWAWEQPANLAQREQTVRLLLEKGADPGAMDKYGRTPLMAAAEADQFEIAQILLELGVDPNVQDTVKPLARQEGMMDNETPAGKTPLHWAITKRNTRLIELLLEKGANPDTPDAAGETPRQMAETLGLLYLFP